jgi:hypothetical protein
MTYAFIMYARAKYGGLFSCAVPLPALPIVVLVDVLTLIPVVLEAV